MFVGCQGEKADNSNDSVVTTSTSVTTVTPTPTENESSIEVEVDTEEVQLFPVGTFEGDYPRNRS